MHVGPYWSLPLGQGTGGPAWEREDDMNGLSLVTGANGHLGNNVVRAVVEAGIQRLQFLQARPHLPALGLDLLVGPFDREALEPVLLGDQPSQF